MASTNATHYISDNFESNKGKFIIWGGHRLIDDKGKGKGKGKEKAKRIFTNVSGRLLHVDDSGEMKQPPFEFKNVDSEKNFNIGNRQDNLLFNDIDLEKPLNVKSTQNSYYISDNFKKNNGKFIIWGDHSLSYDKGEKKRIFTNVSGRLLYDHNASDIPFDFTNVGSLDDFKIEDSQDNELFSDDIINIINLLIKDSGFTFADVGYSQEKVESLPNLLRKEKEGHNIQNSDLYPNLDNPDLESYYTNPMRKPVGKDKKGGGSKAKSRKYMAKKRNRKSRKSRRKIRRR